MHSPTLALFQRSSMGVVYASKYLHDFSELHENSKELYNWILALWFLEKLRRFYVGYLHPIGC